MFAALCMDPEFYKDRLQTFIAIAPVVTLSHVESKLVQDLSREKAVIDATRALGPHNIYKPSEGTPTDFVQGVFTGSFVGALIQQKVMEGMTDANPKLIDEKGQENFMKFFPAGASFQQINHLKQLMHTGVFKHYDYEDESKNEEVYGSIVPPNFNFENMTGHNFDICLICGSGDMLASPKDYTSLTDVLCTAGVELDFQEYSLGHLGLVMPEDLTSTDYIVEKIKKV